MCHLHRTTGWSWGPGAQTDSLGSLDAKDGRARATGKWGAQIPNRRGRCRETSGCQPKQGPRVTSEQHMYMGESKEPRRRRQLSNQEWQVRDLGPATSTIMENESEHSPKENS